MTDLSIIQTAGAIYTPSVPPVYAELVMKDPCSVRDGNLPGGITLDDLNFLNPNSNLFHISHVLYSAGQAIDKKNRCMIKARDKKRTTVIGDSGGYQIVSGILPWKGDQTRQKVLDWLETHCDIAITLDVPTASINDPKSQFQTYRLCLDTVPVGLKDDTIARRPGLLGLAGRVTYGNHCESGREAQSTASSARMPTLQLGSHSPIIDGLSEPRRPELAAIVGLFEKVFRRTARRSRSWTIVDIELDLAARR